MRWMYDNLVIYNYRMKTEIYQNVKENFFSYQ